MSNNANLGFESEAEVIGLVLTGASEGQPQVMHFWIPTALCAPQALQYVLLKCLTPSIISRKLHFDIFVCSV